MRWDVRRGLAICPAWHPLPMIAPPPPRCTPCCLDPSSPPPPWAMHTMLFLLLLLAHAGYVRAHTGEEEGETGGWRSAVVAHGSLMAATWCLLVPAGILVARHAWLVEASGSGALRRARAPFVAAFMVRG
jgi:hypothetical protein